MAVVSGSASYSGGGGGGDLTATYLIQTADGSLPNAQVMASLATGIVKNTTTTGAQSIAVADTDYQKPLTFGNGVTRTVDAISSDLIAGTAGGKTIKGSTDSGATLNVVPSAHVNADGILTFGTSAKPSKFVDSANATGGDYWNFVTGKQSSGKKMVAAFVARGGALGDDVYIGFEPAGGGSAVSSSNQRIECLLLSGGVYQYRFVINNVEVLRLDALTKQTTLMGGIVVPMIAANKTADYVLTLADYGVKAAVAAGAVVITLPDATTCAGQQFAIKRMDTSANALTIKSNGGTVEGAAAGTGITLTLISQARILQSDGTNWWIIAANL